ncbi:MAG: hypothetical protein WKG00_37040 [Polyangiaceae bacterium]
MAGPKRTVTVWWYPASSAPLGTMRDAPSIQPGTSGARRLRARWKAPFLNGPSSPFLERVPSGATQTCTP